MDSMIKVEDVSMKFNLGIEKNFSLKLFFINMFKPKKKDEKKSVNAEAACRENSDDQENTENSENTEGTDCECGRDF